MKYQKKKRLISKFEKQIRKELQRATKRKNWWYHHKQRVIADATGRDSLHIIQLPKMENILKVLDCKEDYMYEGPRLKELGPESGEEFRDEFLIPWLEENSQSSDLTIDFEGTVVYTPSFLEETFGGAVRKNYVQVKNLKFINIPDEQKEDIEKYINDAMAQRK